MSATISSQIYDQLDIGENSGAVEIDDESSFVGYDTM